MCLSDLEITLVKEFPFFFFYKDFADFRKVSNLRFPTEFKVSVVGLDEKLGHGRCWPSGSFISLLRGLNLMQTSVIRFEVSTFLLLLFFYILDQFFNRRKIKCTD